MSDPRPEGPAAAAPFDFIHGTGRIVHGAGALDRLAALVGEVGAGRVLLVLDGAFADGPLAARLRGLLSVPRLEVFVIPGHEPDGDSVCACAGALAACDAQMVVAVGGGSALDTAKASRGLAANPGALEPLLGAAGVAMRAHGSFFVAVPTTAGTGSEVSDSAIIDMPGTIYKAVMRAPHLAPALALLDPELCVTAPAGVTATAGFDALTHAVEAGTSRAANPITDALAFSAVELLAGNLARAVARPDDLAARSACLIASTQAGMAFNSAHLGLAHAIAGALGALHHVPHGLANALALPWTMAFNATALGAKEARLAALLDAPSSAAGLARLRAEVGLDLGLDAYVTTEAERDRLAEAAMTSGQIAVNPRATTLADMRAILEAMRRPLSGSDPVWPVA